MSGKLLDLRFGVKRPDGYESNVWKLWATRHGDVYAATRAMVSIEKYSFHASGICRSAFTSERGIPSAMSDRAMFKWRRTVTPPRGSHDASRVAMIAFPTDFLSRPLAEQKKKLSWIPAAPSTQATFVEFAFTREDQAKVNQCFANRGERQLLHYVSLPSGEAFLVAYSHGLWKNRDLRVPGDGKVNDLFFSSGDPENTGRPIRIRFGAKPNDGDALVLQELGGYALSPPQKAE